MLTVLTFGWCTETLPASLCDSGGHGWLHHGQVTQNMKHGLLVLELYSPQPCRDIIKFILESGYKEWEGHPSFPPSLSYSVVLVYTQLSTNKRFCGRLSGRDGASQYNG